MNVKVSAPINTILQQISVHIEAKMKQARLKKKDLARMADVNQNTITAIMSGGDMKLSTLIRITRALDDTGWLLSLLEQPQESPLDRLNKKVSKAQRLSKKPSAMPSTRPMGRKREAD